MKAWIKMTSIKKKYINILSDNEYKKNWKMSVFRSKIHNNICSFLNCIVGTKISILENSTEQILWKMINSASLSWQCMSYSYITRTDTTQSCTQENRIFTQNSNAKWFHFAQIGSQSPIRKRNGNPVNVKK